MKNIQNAKNKSKNIKKIIFKNSKLLPKDHVLVIVTYDISDNKKRNNIVKILETFGERIQYSVFECILNKRKIITLKKSLLVFELEEGESIIIYIVKSGKYLEKWRRTTKQPFSKAEVL